MPGYSNGALETANTTPSTVSNLNERLHYAEKLAQAELIPKAYRGKPANVLVAIETGHMLGIPPMAALHGIYVIDGQPSYKAGFIAAQVRNAGHRMRTWWDRERAVAVTTIVRSDDPEFEYRSEWDLNRAQRANLVQLRNGAPHKRDSKGNPLPWELYPENLLKARTISEAARDACEEVFYGSAYVPEELGAQVTAEGDPMVIEQQPQQTTEQQQAMQAAADRVDWEGDLATLTGNYEGLRELYRLAKGHEQPQEFLDRVQAAGEAAYERMHGADTADPDSDAPLCPATAHDAHERGDMVMTTQSGREIALCGDCQQWANLQSGHYLPHGQQTNQTTETTDEQTEEGDR